MVEKDNSKSKKDLSFKARGLLSYACFFSINAVFVVSAVAVMLCTPFSPKARRKGVSFLLRNILHFMFFRALPFFDCFDVKYVKGSEFISGGKRIYAPNHTSILDPFIMLALVPNSGILFKRKYEARPTLRLLARYFDFVSVDETSGDSITAAETRILRILSDGGNMIIFPEGKRGPTGRLGDFKRLAFDIAKKSGAKVVPAVITSEKPFLSKGQKGLFPNGRNTFCAEFLPPLNPSDFKTPKAMSESAFDCVYFKLRGK